MKRNGVLLTVILVVILLALSMMPAAADYGVILTMKKPSGFAFSATTGNAGDYYYGTAFNNAAVADYSAKAVIWDKNGEIVATSPTNIGLGVTNVVKYGSKIICSPEIGEGTPYSWDPLTGVTSLVSTSLSKSAVVYGANDSGGLVGRDFEKEQAFLIKKSGEIEWLQGPDGNPWNGFALAVNDDGYAVGCGLGKGLLWNPEGNVSLLPKGFMANKIMADKKMVGNLISTDTKAAIMESAEEVNVKEIFTGPNVLRHSFSSDMNKAGWVIGSAGNLYIKDFVRDPDGKIEWLADSISIGSIDDFNKLYGSSYSSDHLSSEAVVMAQVPEPPSLLALTSCLGAAGLMRKKTKQ